MRSSPVDLHVDVARDGGTLSTRKITARQDGQILLEALASFNEPFDSLDYQQPMPDVTDPDSLPPVQEQLAAYADELGGPLGPVRSPSTCATSTPRRGLRSIWPSRRRDCECGGGPTGSVPRRRGAAQLPADLSVRNHDGRDPHSSCGEPRRSATFNALIDHALWFHRPPIDLTDWVLSDQVSSSGVAGQGADDVDDVQPHRANSCASPPRSSTLAGLRTLPERRGRFAT